jgi:hypothetical protein
MKPQAMKSMGLAVLFLAGTGAGWAAAETPPAANRGSPEGPQHEDARQTGAQPSPKDDFAQMDADNDGRVSPDEYAASPQSAVDRIAAGKRQGPAGITGGFSLANNEGRPDRSRFFRKLDADGDGYLIRNEVSAPAPSSGEKAKP